MGIGPLPDITNSKKVYVVKQKIRSIMFIIKMATALAYLIVLLSFIISFLISRTINVVSWLNTVFVCSLLVMLAGCIMIVIQGGFFDRFMIQFRHFWQKRGKAEEMVREIEGKRTVAVRTETKERTVHISSKVLTVSGGFLVVLSIFLSFLF